MSAKYSSIAVFALFAAATAIPTQSVLAGTQIQARKTYDLAPQALSSALRAIARISSREIIFTEAVNGYNMKARLSGYYTADEAIRAALAGTDLRAEFHDDVVLIKARMADGGAGVAQMDNAPEILVTGSRIRGAPPTSPVIVMDQQRFRDEGLYDLGQAVRSLPQAFGGGQNPGVGLLPFGAGSENLNSASTLNLRGLGQDATLTLLNGHRLAYGGALQGVDISAIPLAAVERVEIVADGASALYGSEAVGGVANVILKQDYNGLSAKARLGTSTDGGNGQQQYDVVGGSRWSSGGILMAYDFASNSPITAGQRSYSADALFRSTTLLRRQKHHNVAINIHQALLDGLSFKFDGIFNKRWAGYNIASTLSDAYDINGLKSASVTQSFSLAPTLHFLGPDQWSLSLSGVYAQDHARYQNASYSSGDIIGRTKGCYCNTTRIVEINADGPLLAMPSGNSAKLAIGAGFRSNHLNGYRSLGSPLNIVKTQQSYYAFGEIFIPLLGPAQALPWLDHLNVSAAVRYENYRQIDKIATPKVGIVFAPTVDIELKGSWGKSFKAPTLYQQYSPSSTFLYPAYVFGGDGYPDSSTGLYRYGGNPDLKPERATNWTCTLVLHPSAIAGLRLELSYFDVNYRSRIVQPIQYAGTALSNPIYSDLVTRNPSPAQIADAVYGPGVEFSDFGDGTAFDPSSVVAIIDDRSLNAARQSIHGIDLAAQYGFTYKGDDIRLNAEASYLHSVQQLSARQPQLSLSGTIFNPPRFRAHGGGAWTRGSLTFATYLSYIGGVSDIRETPYVHVKSMTSWDLNLRYRLDNAPGAMRGVEIGLSGQNLFNDKPETIALDAPGSTPFDSTNYSATGRFLSVSVSKQW